jgi:hypothetical protein
MRGKCYTGLSEMLCTRSGLNALGLLEKWAECPGLIGEVDGQAGTMVAKAPMGFSASYGHHTKTPSVEGH